VDVRHAVTTA